MFSDKFIVPVSRAAHLSVAMMLGLIFYGLMTL